MGDRKKDHIDMAFNSQINELEIDHRFYYEPVLSAHPTGFSGTFMFAGKQQKVPIWISSMTGGTIRAGSINRNLARACNEFGMGMGLGSCRIILDDNSHFDDFDMRSIIGDDLPFFANLGIAQVEEIIDTRQTGKINNLLDKLKADGLIIHVNPLQEWFQPEGDRLKKSPLETISSLLDKAKYPVIIKEVGQGMGYDSLKALLQLPIEAIEFAAFGGTNFAELELKRNVGLEKELFKPLARIGHTALEMTDMVNHIISENKVKCKSLIVSGGIKDFLDGYYLIRKSHLPAIYGQASGFLKYAQGNYEVLREHVQLQIKGLELAFAYLRIKDSGVME